MKVTWLDRRQRNWKSDWKNVEELHLCGGLSGDDGDGGDGDDDGKGDDNGYDGYSDGVNKDVSDADFIPSAEDNFNNESQCDFDNTSTTFTTFIEDDNQDTSGSYYAWDDKVTILPNNDFFADTPYYSAFIEKEMYSLGIRTSTMKDIAKKTKTFGKIGLQMAEAARNLAMSCRFGPDEDMNPDAIQARKDTLGPEMTGALERLGEVLDEIASAQEFMCNHFETSLATHLESFAADVTHINSIRKDANTQTEEAERLFFQYVNGKNAGGNFPDRSRKSRGVRQEKGKNPESEKSLKIANWNCDLQHICMKQASAELKRFQLVRKLVHTQFEHNSELSSSLSNVLSEMQTYFSIGSDLVTGITSDVKEVKDKYHQQQADHKINDYFTWQECENNVLEGLSSMKWAHSVAEQEVERAAVKSKRKGIDNKKKPSASKNFDLRRMESRAKIWDLPSTLASFCNSDRTTPPGVLVEGWLYQRTNSFLTSNAWNRAWFVLKSEGIYCLQTGSVDLHRELTNCFVAKEKKVCDIEACTVRELPDTDPSARFRFELDVSSDGGQVVVLQARGPRELQMWLDGIRSASSQPISAGHGTIANRNSDSISDYGGSWSRLSLMRQASELRCTVLETERPRLQSRSRSFDDVSGMTEGDDEVSLNGKEATEIAQEEFIDPLAEFDLKTGDDNIPRTGKEATQIDQKEFTDGPGEVDSLLEESDLEEHESDYQSDLEYFL